MNWTSIKIIILTFYSTINPAEFAELTSMIDNDVSKLEFLSYEGLIPEADFYAIVKGMFPQRTCAEREEIRTKFEEKYQYDLALVLIAFSEGKSLDAAPYTVIQQLSAVSTFCGIDYYGVQLFYYIYTKGKFIGLDFLSDIIISLTEKPGRGDLEKAFNLCTALLTNGEEKQTKYCKDELYAILNEMDGDYKNIFESVLDKMERKHFEVDKTTAKETAGLIFEVQRMSNKIQFHVSQIQYYIKDVDCGAAHRIGSIIIEYTQHPDDLNKLIEMYKSQANEDLKTAINNKGSTIDYEYIVNFLDNTNGNTELPRDTATNTNGETKKDNVAGEPAPNPEEKKQPAAGQPEQNPPKGQNPPP